MAVTLTHVTPTNAEVYAASKQDIEVAFMVMENGREQTIDTRFYIDRTQYQILPQKGDILTDGTSQFKVVSTKFDAPGITQRIDCEARHQR